MSRHSPPEVASYAGGIISIASSLTLTDVGVIVGIATALFTFILNAIYMYKRDKREELESKLTIEKLLQKGDDDVTES